MTVKQIYLGYILLLCTVNICIFFFLIGFPVWIYLFPFGYHFESNHGIAGTPRIYYYKHYIITHAVSLVAEMNITSWSLYTC